MFLTIHCSLGFMTNENSLTLAHNFPYWNFSANSTGSHHVAKDDEVSLKFIFFHVYNQYFNSKI